MQTAPPTTVADDTRDRRIPPMSNAGILMMNFGFFGIQFSFGLQQTAINPLFQLIGAEPHDLPLLNLAGPMTGLLVQPVIGALSDKTWSDRWGRRKPFFLIGAIGCSIFLFLFPFVGALWMAVMMLWLLDISNNTAMEPYRAFIADRLPKNQMAKGFLTQSLFVGAGAITANLLLFVFQKVIDGSTDAGVPYWVFVAFWIGAICSIGSVLVSVLSTDEIPPTAEELREIRSAAKGPGPMVREIADAVKTMPTAMHKIGLVFLFQWYAMVIYWQFVAVSLSETVFGGDLENAAGWTALMNATYNGATMVAALLLIGIANRFGAKRVHSICLGLAGVALFTVSQAGNQYLALLPMILLGIAWASMLGLPYILVASMVPKERMGVYVGIVNMMIVVPMLIQTFTFGWIFDHLLNGSGSNALKLSAILFACGAVAMLWVNPPPADQESDLMPLAPKQITVYDRVVAGTDGTPTSMYAVARAVEVAAAAQARLIVVSAYNSGAAQSGDRHRKELIGEAAARAALNDSLAQLDSSRLRRIEQRVAPGDPAEALLHTAGTSPASLIVVGNRGLGAVEGQLLGSVPGAVVRHAVCDVLVVQTSALDEDEASDRGPARSTRSVTM